MLQRLSYNTCKFHDYTRITQVSVYGRNDDFFQNNYQHVMIMKLESQARVYSRGNKIKKL